MTESTSIEAIVVGSGFAGAVTACRLAQAGVRVCILERGRRHRPADLPVLSRETFGGAPDEQSAVQSDRKIPDFARAFWQLGQGLWDIRDLGSLVVAQAAGYGGGSLIYANVHLRPPEAVFDNWPAEYSAGALAGYYDLAAYELKVQAVPSPPTLPKTTQFERVAGKLAKQSGFFRPPFRPPLAVDFDRCDMRAECCFGCTREAKNTLDRNYLIEAERLGAEVRTLAEVVSIEPGANDSEYSVVYRDHLKGGQIARVSARHVFLCAGAVNTTELLLRSDALTVSGREHLGTSFHPNMDALAVVFDCKEAQEADRGPTITSSMLYDDGTNWLLVQDGGMPGYLEPLLGVFRSPLWLNRNRFAGTSASPRTVLQRPPYAELPFASLVDALSGLAGGAIHSPRSLPRELGQSLYTLTRGGGVLAGLTKSRPWKLAPKRLTEAMKDLRQRLLYHAALVAQPTLEGLLRDAAENVQRDIGTLLEKAKGQVAPPEGIRKDLAAWALTLGLQLIWGSQASMVGAIGAQIEQRLLPDTEDILGRAADLLRWALEYRIGDGNTGVLLSMGRDSQPWRLGLERPASLSAGARIAGVESVACGVLVVRSTDFVVLTGVTGRFRRGEALTASGRAFAVCDSDDLQSLSVAAGGGDQTLSAAAASATLGVLRTGPLRASPGNRTGFASDPLCAYQPPQGDLLGRSQQERVLRTIAAELGGELRTDPLWTFMDRRVTVHPQGGCRMAESATTGVTNPWGEVFGCPALYVMDAAAFPTPVGVNPSATIMAVAERKVERFIREKVRGHDTWRAAEWDEAGRWAGARVKVLDPLRVSVPFTSECPEIKQKPIGIGFTEVMKGTHWPPGPRHGAEAAVETTLRVSVEDLTRFLEQNSRGEELGMSVKGKVTIWNPAGGAGPATFHVLADGKESYLRFSAGRAESGGEWCTLEYRLAFACTDWVLQGKKDIRNDDGQLDVWEDATTLRFTISRSATPGAPIREGVLRLPAADFFGTQLPSFRATNVDGDPAREVWALSSFARFFLGHLIDVYVPTLDRIADAVQSVMERGHA
jgi:choline dehydrogenase-like flavoprotein